MVLNPYLLSQASDVYDPFVEVLQKISKKGGFVNAHAHFDRAYTVTKEDLGTKAKQHLFEKWQLVDEFKSSASVERYEWNISRAIIQQNKLGSRVCLSFIDIDPVCGTKAMEASQRIKQSDLPEMFEMDFLVASQTLKGVCDRKNRRLLEKALENGWVDVLGCLPRADGLEKMGEHLDIMMSYCKETGLRLHIHCDQLNLALEKETEMIARKTMQWGVEGLVTAVHAISLACHPKPYREKVYKMCKDAGMSFIACPTAWIDHRRSEEYTPTHNAVTPVEELINHGITVAIGSDNIHDIYKPYANGDMATELKFILESLHLYDQDTLVDIATKNGREVLGLPEYVEKKDTALKGGF